MKTSKVNEKINSFHYLKTLVLMQLKDKINLSFLKSKKETLFKTIYLILGISAITALIYLLMSLAVKLSLFSMVKILPISVMVVIFTAIFLISIVVDTYSLSKSLYFSGDNVFLLTMPVKTNFVFFSKIIVFYIYELVKNLFLLFPLFLAYGLLSHFGILYFLWMPICLILISALPVLIGALLSIPTMLLISTLKKHRVVSIFFFAMLIGLFVYVVVSLISLIPADLNIIEKWGIWYWQIQDFLTNFEKIFYPFTMLTKLVVGNYVYLTHKLFSLSTIWTLLSTIASAIILILSCYCLSRPLFFKMASKPFEYDKTLIKHQQKNNKLSKNTSIIKHDWLMFLREENSFYKILSVAILLPIIILLFNKIVSAMTTRLLGHYMGLSFNVLLALTIVLSSNVSMASVYSKQSNASYVERTRPTSSSVFLLSKLIFNFAFIFVSNIVTCAIIGFYGKIGVANTILLFFGIIFIYSAHLLWSAELDFMNPKNQYYQNNAIMQNNPNEKVSNVLAFAISLIIFLIFLLLLTENLNMAFLKLCLIGIAFLATRIILFLQRVKLYYNRRQE